MENVRRSRRLRRRREEKVVLRRHVRDAPRDLTIRETAFVPLVEQIDFQVPFVIRTSDVAPYATATRRLSEVKFESIAND